MKILQAKPFLNTRPIMCKPYNIKPKNCCLIVSVYTIKAYLSMEQKPVFVKVMYPDDNTALLQVIGFTGTNFVTSSGIDLSESFLKNYMLSAEATFPETNS